MGLEAGTIAALSLAMSAVTSVAGIATSISKANAAKDTLARQNAELTRQQKETNRVAREKKSDVVRRADQELGALRAAAADMGASGSSINRLVTEIGGAEGTDLARIEANRANEVESLQASKESRAAEYQQVVASARGNQMNAVLGFAGSGLQIASQYNRDKALEDASET